MEERKPLPGVGTRRLDEHFFSDNVQRRPRSASGGCHDEARKFRLWCGH
jgi:hypothetical protein